MQKLPDATTLTPDQLIERWTVWLKETQHESHHLYSSRESFENVQRMFKSNSDLCHKGSFVLDWIWEGFKTDYLISIRREMEKGGGFLTLVNFLIELERYSEPVLTRDRYVALYDVSPITGDFLANRHFSEKRGAMCLFPRRDKSSDCISSDSIKRLRDDLQSRTKKVVQFANWFIAHRTRQKPLQLKIGEMYLAVDEIFDVYAYVYNLITAGVWAERFPVAQYNWFAPFKLVWITDTFEPFKPKKK